MSVAPISSQLIAGLKSARHVAMLTGAGISAESGVPTFRDAQSGLWAQYDPLELATPQAFQRNPKMVWEWYAHRRQMIAKVKPNAGHFALARLSSLVPKLSLITQNVDGLHQQAGSDGVIELHGNILRVKCFDQHHPVHQWRESGELPPKCPDCDSHLRPDVVWFGESLPQLNLSQSFAAAEACDLFFVIGTSAEVQPAASLPLVAQENNAILVEINPEETIISSKATYILRGPAGKILPALLEKM